MLRPLYSALVAQREGDVEAGVHVVHLAGDAGGQVGAQVGRGVAHVFDRDVAAQQTNLAEVVDQRAREPAMPATAKVRIGPAEIAFTRMRRTSAPKSAAR